MRRSSLILALWATGVFAGEGGVWTGYVNGFVRDPAAPRVTAVPIVVNPFWSELQGRVAAEQMLSLQRQAAWARQQQTAAPQPSTSAEQQLAVQNELLLKQQLLAAQQQVLTLSESVTQKQRELEAQKTIPADAVAKPSSPTVREPEPAAAEELTKSAEASVPAPTRGADVYRWVDADGTVNYSTKLPKDPTIKYKNISASMRGLRVSAKQEGAAPAAKP
jgi:hypothetical protein